MNPYCVKSLNNLNGKERELYKFDIDSIYTDTDSPISSIKYIQDSLENVMAKNDLILLVKKK